MYLFGIVMSGASACLSLRRLGFTLTGWYFTIVCSLLFLWLVPNFFLVMKTEITCSRTGRAEIRWIRLFFRRGTIVKQFEILYASSVSIVNARVRRMGGRGGYQNEDNFYVVDTDGIKHDVFPPGHYPLLFAKRLAAAVAQSLEVPFHLEKRRRG